MFNNRLKSLVILGVACLFLFLVPVLTKATDLPRDVLIKGPGKGTAVYYLAYDNKRYVFPNQQTYLTWFQDFSDVYEVTLDELASFQIGGNVTYRPGVKMVKITSDPQVYAVDHNACLRWVTSEDVAIELYGSDWNTKIDDVPVAFFVDYETCDPIYSSLYYQPLAVAQQATSINFLKSITSSANFRAADTIPDVGDATPRSCTPPAEDVTRRGLSVMAGDEELPSESFMLLGGESDVILGQFKFKSDSEDLKIFSLSVSIRPAVAVSGVRLYEGDIQIAESVAVNASGRAIFENFEFVISKDQTKTLTVKGDIRPFGQGLTTAGQNIQLTLDSSYFKAEAMLPCSDTFISGGVVLGESLPLVAKARVVRHTRPIVSLEPLSGIALDNDHQAVLRFSLTPELPADLAFKRLMVILEGSFQELVTLRTPETGGLRRVSDQSNLEGEYRLSGDCSATRSANCVFAINLDDWEMILDGESQSYEVMLEINGALTVGDTLSARLEGDMNSIPENQSPDVSVYNFAWSDTAYISNSVISVPSWANGAHIQGLPTDIQTLIK